MFASPTAIESLKQKAEKVKDNIRKLGFLAVKNKEELNALLAKYNIVPDKSNVGQTVKSVLAAVKSNDQFTMDVAALILSAGSKAKTESEKGKPATLPEPARMKPSNFDGSSEAVIQIAQDLKSAANTMSAEEIDTLGNEGAKGAEVSDKTKKIFLIVLAILVLAFLYFTFFSGKK